MFDLLLPQKHKPLVLFVGASTKNFKILAEFQPRIRVQVSTDAPTKREEEKGLEPLNDFGLSLRRLLVHNSLKLSFVHHCFSLLFLRWLSKYLTKRKHYMSYLFT